MKNKKKTKKTILCTFITIAVIFVMCASIFTIWVFSDSDFRFIDNVKDISLKLNSTIYYLDNKTGEYVMYDHIQSEENRIWMDLDNIPPDMQNAMVAIEDERFYAHSGVDIKRTFRAVISEFTGGSNFGGSTITQQLIKNLTGDSEHSRARKAREILRAISLERQLDKSEILELYLNTIYLGQNCYGIETASNAYFGKSSSELTLAESACIAGITQYPSKFDPLVNPEANETKRKLVLDKMLELKFINQEEYEEAYNTKLTFKSKDENNNAGSANSYFTDFIIENAVLDIMEKKDCSKTMAFGILNNGGLKIYATIDPTVQNAMDEVYEDNAYFVKNWQGVGVQSAMVISDPYTGEVKGIVGGAGVKEGRLVLNRATQSFRQPGSSIKPLAVYGPAIDTGTYHASSTINDKPIKVGSWHPKNSSNSFTGSMSLRSAIMRSQNIPAINIVNKMKPETSFEYLTEKMHISSLVEDDKNLAAMALGGLTRGLTPIEMVAGYCSFANGGTYHKPIGYTKITDSKDNVIIDNTNLETNQIFSADTAFIMSDLMKGVVQSGTGVGAKIEGMDTAGKTGTTDNNTDRWFAGFTPYYCGVTWYGYDTPQPIYGVSGNPSLNIWKKIMDKIHEGLSPKEFKKPSTVTKKFVCTNSGKLATSRCYGVEEYVTKDYAPSSYCTGHTYEHFDYELPMPSKEKDEDEEENSENSENGENSENSENGDVAAPDDTTPPPEVTPPEVTPPPTENKPVIELN